MITIILAIVLIAMVMLLAVLCMLYFKSKINNQKPPKSTSTISNKKEIKTSKNYSVESAF